MTFKVEILMACSNEPPEVVGMYSTRAEAVIALKATLAKYMNDDDHLGWAFTSNPKRSLPNQCDIYNDFGELASDIFGLVSECIECGRCGGEGHISRGCAGLANDHPELFGGCGVDVTCPDCNGTGQVTLEYILSRPVWAVRIFYHEMITTPNNPLGFCLVENQIDYLMERYNEMPLRDAFNVDFPSDLDAYFMTKYEAFIKPYPCFGEFGTGGESCENCEEQQRCKETNLIKKNEHNVCDFCGAVMPLNTERCPECKEDPNGG